MQPDTSDTIAALASPPGPAERGIIRLSGHAVTDHLRAHFQPPPTRPDRRSHCVAGHFLLPAIEESLPTRLLLWPTNRSYTGEPMAELHTIGSPPLLDAILAELFAGGVRPARAGEFTLRAFLAGRIDLVQAEAVLGVIDSTDQEQLERALRQLGGGVSGKLADIRAELIGILGDLEAGLDFVEEDIEFISGDVMQTRLQAAVDRLTALAGSARARMESATAICVALAGLPNAGKSTLFNALAESELAIVSEVAGTTRDYLTSDIHCDDLLVRLIDTAGQEDAATEVMRLAQEFRGSRVQDAALVVWCSATDAHDDEKARNNRAVRRLIDSGRSVLHVTTKSDLSGLESETDLSVSAATGLRLNDLRNAIAARLRTEPGESEIIGSTGARCHNALHSAITALSAARESATAGLGDEITALEIRAALTHIGEILGTVYTDDILDHIFSNFCIGK